MAGIAVLNKSECRYCDAEIVWGQKPDESWVPLNEHPLGNRVLDDEGFLGPGTGRPIEGVRYVRHQCKRE